MPGHYFVTICTHNKMNIFGEIIGGKMVLTQNGCFIEQCWLDIPKHYPNVKLDAFVVMPNHAHGILIIGCNNDGRRGGVTPPLHKTFNESNVDRRGQHIRQPTLGQIIGYFKYQSTKQINALRGTPTNPVWQRNYYEHIIRNETALDKIRKYIINNPANWETDRNNRKLPKNDGGVENSNTPGNIRSQFVSS
jgi:REP element-mobilizing transposase RayT